MDTGATSPYTRNDYLRLRRKYEPEKPRLIIVAESPPASGLYFYNPNGSPTEPLFAALMKRLGVLPLTKDAGLREFQRRGWLLVDATYQPVNKLTNSERDKVITRDYPVLRQDLRQLSNQPVPIVLVKANVCRLLEPKLVRDNFKVLNRCRIVYFPGHGNQLEFHRQLGEIVSAM
jgi:hypothetical protein